MLNIIDALYKSYSINLSSKAQLAGLFFVFGKLLSIPSFILIFVNKTAALVSITLYSAAIIASFVTSIFAMLEDKEQLRNA